MFTKTYYDANPSVTSNQESTQTPYLLGRGIFKVDRRFQRIDKRKTLSDVFQSLGIELKLLFVPAKLADISFLTKRDEDDLN